MNNHEISLYGAVSEIAKIEQLIEDAQGEIAEDQALALDRLKDYMTTKVDGVCNYNRYLEDRLENLDKWLRKINEEKLAIRRKIQRFADYLITCMDQMGVKDLHGQEQSIRQPKPRKAVDIVDEEAIPDHFKVVQTKVDIRKMEIAKMLKGGVDVPGARLVDGKRTLKFKIGG